MIPLGPAEAAPSPEELLATLKQDLTGLITQDVRGDVDREKVYQYAQARRLELYDRGKQYLAPQMIDNQVADWSPVGTIRYQDQGANGRYDHVINLLRGDKRKFVAVLGQRAPVVKVVPDRSDDEDAIRIARRADLEAHKLYFEWDVERKQRHLANAVWKTTTTFGFTSWVADGAKHGYTEQPKFELQDQEIAPGSYHCIQCGTDIPEEEGLAGMCPNCGAPIGEEDHQPAQTAQVPTQTGVEKYANGAVEFALATVFEVTTPFYARGIEDLPWLLYEYEVHKGQILSQFPELREKLQNDISTSSTGGGAMSQGTLARDTASSPTGTQTAGRKNKVLYTRVWLQPLMFELVLDEEKRKLLVDNFPNGCKVTLVADEVVAIDDEKLVEHWSYCKPDVSEYLYADPICTDFVGIQDLVNDMHNIAIETFERSVPWFLFDPQVLDPVQMKKHALQPGEGVPAKPGVGQQLSNSIWKAPVAEMSPQIGEWVKGLRETGRELTGVMPAIFGADGPSQTAREAELKRNQALMQLGVTWAEMRSFWASVFENGIRLKAKFGTAQGGDEEGGAEEQIATLAEIADGKWHCEAEEAMPMTWGQRRDFFMFLLDKGPEAWQMFGLQDPNNMPQVQQIFGMDGWTIPLLDNRDKVYAMIPRLLQGAPMQDPMTGKVMPSIQIDIFEDDHTLSASVVKSWCQTDKGRAEKDSNPEGYSNVVAWGMAHLDMTMPDPMMGPPPPDGGGGGGGGAPGGGAPPNGPSPDVVPHGTTGTGGPGPPQ